MKPAKKKDGVLTVSVHSGRINRFLAQRRGYGDYSGPIVSDDNSGSGIGVVMHARGGHIRGRRL